SRTESSSCLHTPPPLPPKAASPCAPQGLAEHTVKPPLAEEVVEYGGSYWTLSGKRLPYMRDKTRDSRFFVLTLFAIGRELERRGSLLPFEQIDLAVGLPPEHYGMLRDKFAQYFRRGVVKFTYKEQPI